MHDDARDSLWGNSAAWRTEPGMRTIGSGTTSLGSAPSEMAVELTAAVLAIRDSQPVVLVQPAETKDSETAGDHLPAGGFRPRTEETLETALRDCVRSGTGVELGYIDQLSTAFERTSAVSEDHQSRCLSVGYLALTRMEDQHTTGGAEWADCYAYLPWEDFRSGRPAILTDELLPRLQVWAAQDEAALDTHALSRPDRLKIAFGIDGGNWDDERVVDRFDIIVEAGLGGLKLSRPMPDTHRRILCAALGRLRAKIRYRPVVFELLPAEFTLFELQKTVEAILGPNLHKQNFRRLVEGTRLVEPTGTMRNHTGGRPAKLFRFRHGVLLERPAPGVRVRLGRVG